PLGVPDISGCPGVGKSKSFLGVSASTQQDFTFPFPITIDTADIGGPSAGLAMTLGIINELSDGRLTGGTIVAATGTIDPAGAVGDVGGVAQKTVAVERAGATVFFVPPPELGVARSKATSSLHVFAVSSLAQALSDLRHLGGQVPSAGAHPS
ncbi:MAG: S16 family serine protease, partial [Acidimicrobiales bacterium]